MAKNRGTLPSQPTSTATIDVKAPSPEEVENNPDTCKSVTATGSNQMHA